MVRVMEVTNLEDPNAYPSQLYRYKGIVAGGGWRTTEISQLSLTSVLDAISVNLPVRSIHQRTLGSVHHLKHCQSAVI